MRIPNIDAHPYNTTLKHGFGLNMEQELTEEVRLFMRAGWNEGPTRMMGLYRSRSDAVLRRRHPRRLVAAAQGQMGCGARCKRYIAPSSAILGARRTGLPAGRWKFVIWPGR